jgi:hypothetical protein
MKKPALGQPFELQMAEEEGKSRRELETKVIDAQVEAMRRQFTEARFGQVFAFVIAVLFLGCGTYVATLGQALVGALFGGIGLGGIVTTFIVGRSKTSPDPKEDALQETPASQSQEVIESPLLALPSRSLPA